MTKYSNVGRIVYLRTLVIWTAGAVCFVQGSVEITAIHVEPSSIVEHANVSLTCEVSPANSNATVDWYRVFRNIKRKVSVNVQDSDWSNSSHVLNDVNCYDIGWYECQAYTPDTLEKAWKRIEIVFPCTPVIAKESRYQYMYVADVGNDVTLTVTLIASPQPEVTWYKLTNLGIPTPINCSAKCRVESRTFPIERHKRSYVLHLLDVDTDDYGVYTLLVHGAAMAEPVAFVLLLNPPDKVTPVGRLTSFLSRDPSSMAGCQTSLLVGWLIAGVLLLTLVLVGLGSATLRRKEKRITKDIHIDAKTQF